MQISEILTYKFKDLESGIALWFLRGTHRPQMKGSCSNESLNVPVGVVLVIYTSREDRIGMRCVRNDAYCYQHWVSAELRRGEKEQLSHIVQENIFVQIDLGFLFLCYMYMSLWMHAPLGVYKPVWGIESYPAGETDICGTWVLGLEFWPSLLSSNHSEPLSHPSSPGFRVLKALKFLVAVIVTYFNHFQSWWSKMSSGPTRHVFCPEVYHLGVGKQLFWDWRWERSGWVFFSLVVICLFSLWNNIYATSFPVFIFFSRINCWLYFQ